VALVEALLERRRSVQFLLLQDGEEIRWDTQAPAAVALDAFREGGLQSLPEGAVAVVTGTAVTRGPSLDSPPSHRDPSPLPHPLPTEATYPTS